MPQEDNFAKEFEAFRALPPEEQKSRLRALKQPDLDLFEQHLNQYLQTKKTTPAPAPAPAQPWSMMGNVFSAQTRAAHPYLSQIPESVAHYGQQLYKDVTGAVTGLAHPYQSFIAPAIEQSGQASEAFGNAIQAIRNKQPGEALRQLNNFQYHFVGTIPGFGPAAQEAAAKIKRGDYSGALADITAMVAVPELTEAFPEAARMVPGVERLAKAGQAVQTKLPTLKGAAQTFGNVGARKVTRPYMREAGAGIRADRLQSELNTGGEKMGLDTVEANKQLVGEENQLYNEADKLMGDESTPLDDIGAIASRARRYIEGTRDLPKVFRDIQKRQEDWVKANERIQAGEGTETDDAIVRRLSNVTVRDQIGYIRELNSVLENENLPNDIEQASTHLRDMLKEEVSRHAENTEASGIWKQANDHHFNRMKIFGDKGEALRGVRDAVRTETNTDLWWDAFNDNSRTNAALRRLRSFPTEVPANRNLLNNLADHIEGLRQTQDALDKVAKGEAEAGVPGARPEANRQLPTPQGLRARRTEALERGGIAGETTGPQVVRRLGVVGGFGDLIASIFGGHPNPRGAIISGSFILGPMVYAKILGSDWFRNIALKATPRDIAEIDRAIPEGPEKDTIKRAFQGALDESRKRGQPLSASPSFKQWLITGTAVGGIQNRADAMRALGRNPQTGTPQQPYTPVAPVLPTPESRLESAPQNQTAGTTGELSPTGMQALARAIATQEGFWTAGSIPQRQMNPGDISPGGGQPATYGSVEEGWNALFDQLATYDPDQTLAEVGGGGRGRGGYATDPNWAAGVAKHLSDQTGKTITPEMTLAEIDDAIGMP